MAGQTVIYYVSGHGMGHARRSAEVIRQLLAQYADVQVVVRTSARAEIFDELNSPRVRVAPAQIDPGCVEQSILEIDEVATLQAARHFVAQSESTIASEANFVRQSGATLLLSDIAFIAGPVAQAAGLPCLAVSNFTWDWIFEAFARDEEDQRLLRFIETAYAQMNALIRLPYGGVARFSQVIDAPLVASRSEKAPADVLYAAGIDPKDDRPRVLIAARGAISPAMIHQAAQDTPECLFVLPYQQEIPARNVRAIPAGRAISFADLLSISTLAVSKLGYGIVSDCLAAGVGLLWPRRVNFREDAVTEFEAARYIRMHELPTPDFYAGRWAAHVRALLGQALPREKPDTTGATRCARLIIDQLQ